MNGVERTERDKEKDWALPPPQRIEGDRKEKEEFRPPNRREEETRSLLFAILGLFCKKFLSLFSSKEKLQAALFDLKQIAHDLQGFKTLLQQLSREDVSRNSHFSKQFSEFWKSLLEDLRNIESFERERPDLGPKIKHLIEKIATFPPFVDHPLGYYLAAHVGEEWLPIPFMEILSGLHKEHQEKHERSELHSWIALIDFSLSSLSIHADLV